MANSTVSAGAKPKGKPRGASRKGIPNRATAQAREAIALFVDGNAHRLQDWLNAIAEDEKQGPAVAYRLFMEVLEYHVPKLARIEHAGDAKHPVEHRFSWKQ